MTRNARITGSMMDRRRFLQSALAGAAAVSAAGLPLGLGTKTAHAATSSDANVLVLINLDGGNDGLNMIAPDTGTYRDLRQGGAIDFDNAHKVQRGLYMHPSMPWTAAQIRQGTAAMVRRVGSSFDEHSHFVSLRQWATGEKESSIRPTGWMGRFLDQAAPEGFGGISIGGEVPLHLTGRVSRVTTLPLTGSLFGTRQDRWATITHDVFTNAAKRPSQRGTLADAIAKNMADTVASAKAVAPVYDEEIPGENQFVKEMELVARVVNLGLGTRVISVRLSGFDTHSAQLGTHDDLLATLDSGLKKLFATVSDPTKVTAMTFSEFGRRLEWNDSGGTDHGAASTALVVGAQVNGGDRGASSYMLNSPSYRGDILHEVDFLSMYQEAIEWLNGDAREVLGGNYTPLGLFR